MGFRRLTGTRRLPAARFAAVVLLIAAGLVVAPAAPASASEFVSCPSLGNRDWHLVSSPLARLKKWESYDYLWFNATPTFNVSDTRIAVNDLDSPLSTTFTSQKSQTWSISLNASMTKKLTEVLTGTLGVTIQASRTTSIGVSVTATVPPHSAVRGDYGVRAYEVDFEAHTYERQRWPDSPYICLDHGVRHHHVNAPTDLEGWRVAPL